ncbi:MAG: hypothetical protein WAV90_18150 [Gordonia amarae]
MDLDDVTTDKLREWLDRHYAAIAEMGGVGEIQRDKARRFERELRRWAESASPDG